MYFIYIIKCTLIDLNGSPVGVISVRITRGNFKNCKKPGTA